MTPRALPTSIDAASRTHAVGALAAVLLALAPAMAAADEATASFASGAPALGALAELVEIPGGAWRAARKDGDGRLYFISANGRWVVRGEAYDLWAGERLSDFDAVRRSAQTISFRGLGAVWDDLDPVEFGTGDRELVAFVDPRCPYCHALLKDLEARAGRLRVRVVEIPLLGRESGELVRQLHCAADREARAAALLDVAARRSLAPDPACDLGALQRRLVTAQMIGLRAVPFLVDGADGRFVEGAPQDLDAWIGAAR